MPRLFSLQNKREVEKCTVCAGTSVNLVTLNTLILYTGLSVSINNFIPDE